MATVRRFYTSKGCQEQVGYMGYNDSGDWGWIGISQFRPCGTSGKTSGASNNPNMERVAFKQKPSNNTPTMVGIADGNSPFSVVDSEKEVEATLEPTFLEKYGLWVAVIVIVGGLIAYFVLKK